MRGNNWSLAVLRTIATGIQSVKFLCKDRLLFSTATVTAIPAILPGD
ncbi:hypothetical protein SAMN05444672_12252 [Bacillus sp. OK838]|nr:hypothetical protein SAMN05444672_12252 [Bacillus sp. OK838]